MFRKDQKVPKIKLLASETRTKRSLTWCYRAIRGTQWHQIAQTLQYLDPVALAQQSWSNEAELALSTPTLSAIVLLFINGLKCLLKVNAFKSDALKLGRLKYPHHHMGGQDPLGVGAGSERGEKHSFITWRLRYEKPGRQTMGKSQQAGLRQLRKDQVCGQLMFLKSPGHLLPEITWCRQGWRRRT